MAYVGVSPSNGVRQKHTYTATAGQTSFSGAGSENITLSYLDSNYVDVYQNGVKLGEADYTSTTGTTVVLAQGASVSDIVEIIVYDVFSVADTVSKADGGTFDGNVTMAGTITVTGNADLNGNLDVDGTIEVDDKVTIAYEAGSSDWELESTSGDDFTISRNGSQKLLIDGSTSNTTLANGLTLTDGDLVVASGHGIDFSANTGQSGQSSEIFHHYEEGTFTPMPYSNVTQITTSSATGFYTKIGNRVFVNGSVTRNDTASLTSTFQLRNLPFSSSSASGNQNIGGGFWFDTASSTDQVGFAFITNGENRLYAKTLGLSAAYITADALEHGRPLYFSAMYFVD